MFLKKITRLKKVNLTSQWLSDTRIEESQLILDEQESGESQLLKEEQK